MKFIGIFLIFMVASVNAHAAGGGFGDDSQFYKVVLVRDLEVANKTHLGRNTWATNMILGGLDVEGFGSRRPTTLLQFPNNDREVYFRRRVYNFHNFTGFVGTAKTFNDGATVVYAVNYYRLFPQLKLPRNEQRKLFKAQWVTVKDGELYVGGNGHRLKLPDGSFNDDQMWVQIVNGNGTIRWADWSSTYAELRRVFSIGNDTGYLVITACQWSNYERMFYMLPRGISPRNRYEDIHRDGYKGSRFLINLNENGEPLQFFEIRTFVATRSFTALQFVPGTNDTLIATLEVEEGKGLIAGDSFMSINNVEEGYYTVNNEKASTRFRYNTIVF